MSFLTEELYDRNCMMTLNLCPQIPGRTPAQPDRQSDSSEHGPASTVCVWRQCVGHSPRHLCQQLLLLQEQQRSVQCGPLLMLSFI